MRIHDEKAPLTGRALLEKTIDSDLTLKTPLAVELCSCLVDEGLVDEKERSKYEICFEEALNNAIVHGNKESAELSVSVRLFVDESEAIWGLSVDDEGAGFDENALLSRENLPLTEREDGWGVQVMSETADFLEHFRGGRTLYFVKSSRSRRVRPESLFPDWHGTGVRVTDHESTTIATVETAKLDDAAADLVFDEIKQAIASKSPRVVILDLSGVSFLSSFAIGRIVALLRTCQGKDIDFCVAGCQDEVRKVLQFTHLDTVLTLHDSLQEAMA